LRLTKYVFYFILILYALTVGVFLNKGAVRNVFGNRYAFVFMELKRRENVYI